MEIKFILIIGCSGKQFWYKDKIGTLQPFIKDVESRLGLVSTVTRVGNVKKVIRREDAIPVAVHFANGFVYAFSNKSAKKNEWCWHPKAQCLVRYEQNPLGFYPILVATNAPTQIADGIMALKGLIPLQEDEKSLTGHWAGDGNRNDPQMKDAVNTTAKLGIEKINNLKSFRKPPLGITPEFLHKENRLEEIQAAILRYQEANAAIPVAWISEKKYLESWIIIHKKNLKTKQKICQ